MIELIIPNDIDGDKRYKTTAKKAAGVAKKHSKTHDVVIGAKKAKPSDVKNAKSGAKVKLIKKQVGG